jgi:hypothetical protein
MTLMNQTNDDALMPIQSATPAEVIAQATDWANHLMDIVSRSKLAVEINKKQYLPVEAWQIVGAFAGIKATTEWVREIRDEGKLTGYEAKVHLVRNGEVVGSGIMPCGFDEFPCRGKQGYARNKAAMSSAQTWATGKAYRQNFSWVVVLAGYQPTPLEEIKEGGNDKPPASAPQRPSTPTTGTTQAKPQQARPVSSVKCPVHDVNFNIFTKDGNTWLSHKDGSGWCNEKNVMAKASEGEVQDL